MTEAGAGPLRTSRPGPGASRSWLGRGLVAGALVLVVLALVVIGYSRRDDQAATPSAASTSVASSAPTVTITPTTAPIAAGTVTGRLGYPSDFIPALAIYALPTSNTADGRYVTFNEQAGATAMGMTYTMRVPPGTYYFVAYRRDAPAGTNLAGGYTRFVTCGMQPPCADHSLIPVTVSTGQTVTDVDIRDWYLPQGQTFPPQPR